MRLLFTFLLMLSAAVLVTLGLVREHKSDFLSLFSTQQIVPEGETLFKNDLRTTFHIQISQQGRKNHSFTYQKHNGLWFAESPWHDRADGPFAINQLVLFALNAEVIDSFEPEHKSEREDYGVGDNGIKVQLKDSTGKNLANFIIGHASAWKKRIEGKQDVLVPCVYIRDTGAGMRKQIYLCTDVTGGIHRFFENDWQAFRDPRPFALNIHTLETVRMKRGKTETVITRKTPTSEWQITKPLELDTDRKALASYLTNLSKLTASKLVEPGTVSLPEKSQSMLEISVSQFGAEDKDTTLTVYQPAEGATTTYATVSDRDVIFELPLIASFGVSNYLTQLPESVNALRSRAMVKLHKKQRADLRTIIVRSPQRPSSEPIIITRTPNRPYEMLLPGDIKQSVDEIVLTNLLQVISLSPVKDFASDAATDLTPYGLDKPMLIIDLLFFKEKPIQLLFGKHVKVNKNDNIEEERYFATLRGTHIVWEIDTPMITSIATNTWQWKPKTIWNLPVIDITGFSTQRRGQQKLEVSYDFTDDVFHAKQGDEDLSEKLNANQAKYFLNENHLLVAESRLGPDHAAAIKALENPIYSLTISVQKYDDEGIPEGVSTYSLKLAKPNKSGASAFYYAKADNDPDYLILSLDTVRKLAANNLFAED